MILDGKIASEKYIEDIKLQIEKYKENGHKFKLAVIQTVVDDASLSYLKGRIKMCEKVGVELDHYDYSNKEKEEVISLLEKLNLDETIDGIMVDRPFPKGWDEMEIYSHLNYKKDVDGCTIFNAGLLFQNKECFVPSTAKAVIELLDFYKIDVEGKNVVVVGRSKTVGAPVAQLLTNKNATVTVCHSRTRELKEITKKADIVVVAIGKKAFITKDYLSSKSIVVDVGIHYNEDGKMCGDVDKSVYEFVESYSPVPRGVGPLTNVSLMKNIILAKEMKIWKK